MNIIVLLIVLFLLFGGGYGYYRNPTVFSTPYGWGGSGLGVIVVIFLVVWLLRGGF